MCIPHETNELRKKISRAAKSILVEVQGGGRPAGVQQMVVGTRITEKLKLRLIAAPIDEETANLRRMRAKREMSGHNRLCRLRLTRMPPGTKFKMRRGAVFSSAALPPRPAQAACLIVHLID